jgi:predicted nucleic acid-binding protein
VKHIEAALEVIPLGIESAEVFAMLKADLEKGGAPLDDFDLVLAACALSHGLTLVANNVKHFKRIDGLKLENWTRDLR